MSLWSEFLNHRGNTIQKWKHYFPAYERHFSRFVNRPMMFLEIGCGLGGSLQMWKGYFGPHARIVGIDVRPECQAYEEDQVSIRIGNQADPEFLASVINEFGQPNIVLDDGSHIMEDMVASFEYLYQKMSMDGVYMAEDLHTAYWNEYGGGLLRRGSFIELCKSLVDDLNADWWREGPPSREFARTTQSMHFYDSIAVFERGRTLDKGPQMHPKPPT